MLQNLLAERFKLVLHRERKDLRGYALMLGQTSPRMEQSAPVSAESSSRSAEGKARRFDLDKDGFIIVPPGSFPSMMTMPPTKDHLVRLTAARASTAILCGYLSRQLQRPVVDETGLTGTYDFHLAFAPEGVLDDNMEARTRDAVGSAAIVPRASEPAPTLVKAVEVQLGLKMAQRRMAVEVLMIDHVERTPAEN
jgi:uncharacterized protein (TIGR03435 family)